MKPLSLRTKLTLFYVTLFSIVLIAFSALFYRTLDQRLERNVDEDLVQISGGLHGYLQIKNGRPELAYDANNEQESDFIHSATRFFEVRDGETGEVILQSREVRELGVTLSPEEVRDRVANPGFGNFVSPRGRLGYRMTSIGRLRFHNSVLRNSRRQPFLIRVGASLAPVDAAMDGLARVLALLVPGAVLVSAMAGWWLAGRALAPVDAITRAAGQIDIGQLDRRLPVRGADDELDRLAATFNRVFARLQSAVEQMRQFTASISHELRTPLTALRGEAEVALLQAQSVEDYRRLLASQLEEFDKLTRMVNELLTLARAEAGEIRIERQNVELGRLVRSVVEQIEPVAAWKKVELRADSEGDVRVACDPRWIERAIVNLLDNAIKFTPEGGKVEVRVGANGALAALTVRDTGIGIPPEAIPHVFERFYRADPSRSRQVDGAGLGLTLVRWIVEAHQGNVEVESQPNRGTSVTIRLPLAQAEAPAYIPMQV